ncbi:MAG TPA: hypothetical protein PLE54_10575 [Burkholderiaceae bacterium]|nr:hypothetical protein [Burkholderiaceae bacterium]HQR71037.1 hypothetical protein [Burkholderiaceae bacterium]
MHSDIAHRNDEWLALIDDALRNWPVQHGFAMAKELAALCEQLAPLMRSVSHTQIEALLPRAASPNPIDNVHINFVCGSTLLTLAEQDDDTLAMAAASRLAEALALARRHVPAEVPAIKWQLCRAEHMATMSRNAGAARMPATVEF